MTEHNNASIASAVSVSDLQCVRRAWNASCYPVASKEVWRGQLSQGSGAYWPVWLSLHSYPIMSPPLSTNQTHSSLNLSYQLIAIFPAGTWTLKNPLTASEESSSLTAEPEGIRGLGITDVGAVGQVNSLHWFWSHLNAIVIRHSKKNIQQR